MADRSDRALSQRMYLLGATHTGDRSWEFHIEGSRGVPYKVFMGPNRSTCSCPDYTRRRAACKHIIFISLRVLRLTSYSTVVTADMDAALSRLLERMTNPAAAEEKPRSKESKPEDNDKDLEGESCPICFEDLEVKSQCDKCHQCRKYIHKACIIVWLGQKPNCPLCRAPWRKSGGSGGGIKASTLIRAGEIDDAMNKFSNSAGAAPPPSPGTVERITASIAKKQYKLTEQDLHTLDYLPVTNPVYPGGAPMRLFLVSDVKRLGEEKQQNRQGPAATERRAESAGQRAEREKMEKKEREKQEKTRAKQEKERLKQEKKAAKEAVKATKEAAKEAKRAEGAASKQQTNKKAKARIEETPESAASNSNGAGPRRSSRAARPRIVVTEVEDDDVQPRTKRSRRA